MARYLYVLGGVVLNIVDYGLVVPPLVTDAGEDVFADPTGTASVGDAFDAVAAKHQLARTAATAQLNTVEQLGKVLRAIAATLIDELNLLRGQVIGVGSAVWNPASMANATGVTSPNVTVTGTRFGDMVDVAAPYSLAGIVATAYVVANDTVAVRLQNGTGAVVDLISGTWNVAVRRPVLMPDRTLAQARTAIENKITVGTVDT